MLKKMWGKKAVSNASKMHTIFEMGGSSSTQSPSTMIGSGTTSVSTDGRYRITSTPTKIKAVALVGRVSAISSSPSSSSSPLVSETVIGNRSSGDHSVGYSSMNSSQSSASTSGTPQKLPPSKASTNPAGNQKSVALRKNHVELFVKTGRDGKSYGACPMCQQIFMVLLIKAQIGSLTFSVTTINTSKPPREFKDLSNRVPTLIHCQEVLKDTDEIVEYIEKNFPMPALAPEYNGSVASEICADLMSKLAFFLKDVSGSSAQLIAELRRIDEFLAKQNSRFLCGDRLSSVDCVVLPKLQHIRVASKAFKRLELPHNLVHLWRYLMFAYNNENFKKTCPCDQEIIFHWYHKLSDAAACSGINIQELMTGGSPDRHSWDIPKDIKIPPLL